MIVCDICGVKLSASEWPDYYVIIPSHHQPVDLVSSESKRLNADRDFCPDCWGRIVDYIEEAQNEHRNQMR